jgi:hypothetical protein
MPTTNTTDNTFARDTLNYFFVAINANQLDIRTIATNGGFMVPTGTKEQFYRLFAEYKKPELEAVLDWVATYCDISPDGEAVKLKNMLDEYVQKLQEDLITPKQKNYIYFLLYKKTTQEQRQYNSSNGIIQDILIANNPTKRNLYTLGHDALDGITIKEANGIISTLLLPDFSVDEVKEKAWG